MRWMALALVLMSSTASALGSDQKVPAIAGLPATLDWQHTPVDWRIDASNSLSITAGKQTDWFVSPIDGVSRDNSPRLLFHPANDFVLSAKISVTSDSQWDGGALVIYAKDGLWAKLAIEKSIEGRLTIVSVVTRSLSDDSNSITVQGRSAYLKMAKAEQGIFFYASEDGQKWSIIRAFSLGQGTDLRVGFSSQSPLGEGCTTVFENIRYTAKRVNLWTGE